MERIELLNGVVAVRQPEDQEGVGYELRFEVERGSASDVELEYFFRSGAEFPFVYHDQSIAVSLRSMAEQESCRVYEGTAGFLRPGMGSGGG